MKSNAAIEDNPQEKIALWGGIWGMAIGVASLVTAEFMPVSLLTPMAHGLGVSEGIAGQTISATAVVAVLTSVFLPYIIRTADRRLVMLGFSMLMIISSLIVASASSFSMLLVGRVFLGMSLGGFWSMSTSVAVRLVPQKDVTKAFAIIFGGVSAASVISGPLGSILETFVGWRVVFLFCAGFSALGLVWQFLTLPAMPAQGKSSLSLLYNVFMRHDVRIGMACVGLTFGGHMAFFTYMRPFLETVAGVNVSTFTSLLLTFGIANFIGNSISGTVINRSLRASLVTVPFMMFALVILLLMSGTHFWLTALCVTLWGFAFGFIPVGWSTWLTRAISDETEAGGSIYVACIQFGLLAGAGVGGILLDAQGVNATFIFAGSIMLLSAALIYTRLRLR
ncbi:MFS transporter [Enterobacter sp. C2]|uniref:MFS transporter n=1 Tax=Enterobacter sp. C2 TaxID=2870346 RepID=UPI001CA40CAA|nr:MFS transporter [Enterobacter sp. C2]